MITRRRAIFAGALALGACLLSGVPRSSGGEEAADPHFRALDDELARTMTRLKMGDFAAPYYASFTLNESDSWQVSAVFGAITSESGGPGKGLSTQVRVGDYVLESIGGGGGAAPLNDDYDATRHSLWLQADQAYKQAVDGLTRKKAYLANQHEENRPDDFTKVDPVVVLEEPQVMKVSRDRWRALVKRCSAIFREFPEIQQSSVGFYASAQNQWFVTSEGSRQRTSTVRQGLSVSALALCDDGMPLSDSLSWRGRTEQDLPTDEAIVSAARELAGRLTSLRSAPKAEDYTGPVLLLDEAAASFFSRTLGYYLGAVRDEGGYGGTFDEKIGKPVMSGFLSAWDDPTLSVYEGKPLLGAYTVDDDGVRGQRVSCVENGRLVTLLTSRVPTRRLKVTNGHSRGGSGGVSNLFVSSTKTANPEGLKKALIEATRDAALEYGLMTRSMGGNVGLIRVWVEDGREEPLRGGDLSAITPRALRDIVLTGDVMKVEDAVGSVVAPSVLVRELEFRKPPEKFENPPKLQNPFFEKK